MPQNDGTPGACCLLSDFFLYDFLHVRVTVADRGRHFTVRDHALELLPGLIEVMDPLLLALPGRAGRGGDGQRIFSAAASASLSDKVNYVHYTIQVPCLSTFFV